MSVRCYEHNVEYCSKCMTKPDAPTMAEIQEPIERAHKKLFTECANTHALPELFTKPAKGAGEFDRAGLLSECSQKMSRRFGELRLHYSL